MRHETYTANSVPELLKKRLIRNIILQSRYIPATTVDSASMKLHNVLIHPGLSIGEKWLAICTYKGDQTNQDSNLYQIIHWVLAPFNGRNFWGALANPSPHFFTFGRTPLSEADYIKKLVELEELISLFKLEQRTDAIDKFILTIIERYKTVIGIQQSDESYLLCEGLESEYVSSFEKLEMVANYVAAQDRRGYFDNNGKSLARIIMRTMSDFMGQCIDMPFTSQQDHRHVLTNV